MLDRKLHHIEFSAPSIVAGYNNFMGGINQMDQLCSTNIMQWHEKHLCLMLYTMLLDMSASQAYCISKLLQLDQQNCTLVEFKHVICERLVVLEIRIH